uniref:Tc1-like transposase DDE domain-containing protein n=1 Tax=Glossina palpalis gambiensis TaxID=67801 RepID=A0A1B0AR11_9MUSC
MDLGHYHIQNDNAPLHIAKNFQFQFNEHRNIIKHIPWPAQLPDLNIIESLWGVLEENGEGADLHLRKSSKPLADGLIYSQNISEINKSMKEKKKTSLVSVKYFQ